MLENEPTIEAATWTQRVSGLVELPALLRGLGADPREVLAEAGLEAQALDHPDNRISFVAAARLLHVGAQRTDCPQLGLLAGERWALSHYGTLGQLMLNSSTVGEALRHLAVYQSLYSDVGAVFLLNHEGVTSLGYTIYRESVPHQALIYDAAMAFSCNLLRELCGPRWMASEVTFSRAEPRDPSPYRRHFQASLQFDYPYSAVRFRTRWCQRPVAGADAERRRELIEALSGHEQAELGSRLRRTLRLLLISGKCSGDELAQTLSLHRRTLNRRLQAQGTTFQRVLDEVRSGVAQQLLEHTLSPVGDIAAALCYADTTAFMHAFRRWTGTTPSKWRESRGGR